MTDEDCITPERLVGITEIAERAGVRPDTVRMWIVRHETFPPPVARLTMGHLWDWRTVEAWLSRPRLPGRPKGG